MPKITEANKQKQLAGIDKYTTALTEAEAECISNWFNWVEDGPLLKEKFLSESIPVHNITGALVKKYSGKKIGNTRYYKCKLVSISKPQKIEPTPLAEIESLEAKYENVYKKEINGVIVVTGYDTPKEKVYIDPDKLISQDLYLKLIDVILDRYEKDSFYQNAIIKLQNMVEGFQNGSKIIDSKKFTTEQAIHDLQKYIIDILWTKFVKQGNSFYEWYDKQTGD